MADATQKKMETSLVGDVRKVARLIYYKSLDFKDWIQGKRHPMTPPHRMIRFVGGSDFHKTGKKWIRIFREKAALQVTDQVLDVGCGAGRLAIPLTNFLNQEGSYDGFDIDRDCIQWCQKNITTKFPKFRFKHVDLHNNHYNPNGKLFSSTFSFPYSDNSFDFVYLTSVFTHMLSEDIRHYLAEIHRVLKPGGRVCATAFLVNEETLKLISEGKSKYDFIKTKDYYAVPKEVAEAAIGFDEPFFLEMVKSSGLSLYSPVEYGTWRGTSGNTSQDIVILNK